MAKNKKEKAKISFIGESANSVTGSSYLLKYKDETTMIDCGFVQVSNKLKQWRLNNSNYKFKVKEVDNIILTHFGHLDHSGGIPRLYANGCKAKIFASKGARQYLKLSFEDGYKIQLSDAELLTKQTGKEVKIGYTEEDIENALNHIVECDENEIIHIGEHTTFRFTSSYHIVRANQVEIFIKDGNYNKTIYFSGDLGNTNINKPFLEEFNKVKSFDVGIVETTYAMNPKSVTEKDRLKDREKIKTSVRQTCEENKGKLIIASFSMQRLQELMYEFYTLYKDDKNFTHNIVIDTPLGIKICEMFGELIPDKDYELWDEIINWDKFIFIKDWKDSESAITSIKPSIYIASSGFCSGGRIRNYIQSNLGNDKNTFMFVGYSSEDSLAGMIKSGKKKVLEVDGVNVKNNANVVNLLSFSSHIQHKQMLELYSGFNCNEIYLTHGEKENQYKFAQVLTDEYLKLNKTTKVFVPIVGDEIEI